MDPPHSSSVQETNSLLKDPLGRVIPGPFASLRAGSSLVILSEAKNLCISLRLSVARNLTLRFFPRFVRDRVRLLGNGIDEEFLSELPVINMEDAEGRSARGGFRAADVFHLVFAAC